jgi:hypothetical protein
VHSIRPSARRSDPAGTQSGTRQKYTAAHLEGTFPGPCTRIVRNPAGHESVRDLVFSCGPGWPFHLQPDAAFQSVGQLFDPGFTFDNNDNYGLSFVSSAAPKSHLAFSLTLQSDEVQRFVSAFSEETVSADNAFSLPGLSAWSEDL